MKVKQKVKQNIGSIALLFVAPLATGLSAGVAPSNAATLANSAAEVAIDNFSHRPGDTGRSSVTDTDTVSFDGLAIAEANANAVFIANCHQLLAQNISESQVSGAGNLYAGLAQSQASVIGDFAIAAEETFSFAFQAILHSLISVDNPESERASATGKISFLVIDTVTSILLDSFELVSGLHSANGILLNVSGTAGFQPNNINFDLLSEGSPTKSILDASGVYSRTFNRETKLRLLEVKNNIAEVAAEPVPEPSTILGTAMFFGLLFKSRKLKQQKTQA
ncbi:MAG: PEP-CTERM sorting domain-containing protein [Oscillatoriaceae cyanobacterium Prado104]|jgi:hypothetical protein|nr:PEP-CTERM sorting domain-containing protein [Oscillatoriaceae cyanobacterium Prado104]